MCQRVLNPSRSLRRTRGLRSMLRTYPPSSHALPLSRTDCRCVHLPLAYVVPFRTCALQFRATHVPAVADPSQARARSEGSARISGVCQQCDASFCDWIATTSDWFRSFPMWSHAVAPASLRTANDIITRVMPLIIMLTPTKTPIAQTELEGHCR